MIPSTCDHETNNPFETSGNRNILDINITILLTMASFSLYRCSSKVKKKHADHLQLLGYINKF